jgi:hypothetical protein
MSGGSTATSTSPDGQVWIGGHCIPTPPKPIHPDWVKKVIASAQEHQPHSHPPDTEAAGQPSPPPTSPQEEYGPHDPVILPDEPYCWKSDDAIEHFLGPWSLIAAGRDGDGGWAAVQAYCDVGIEGKGEPFDKWANVDDIRARAWDWASFHDKEMQAFLGTHPTRTICTTAMDGDEAYPVNHAHSGTWDDWLNSLTINGRWLDLPALLCLMGALDFAAYIVEARHGQILCYHLGDINRDDWSVIYLGLHNGHWHFIKPRSTEYYPEWWFETPPTWPNAESINGG